MKHRIAALAAATALGTSALVTGTADADGGATVKPTKDQKAAVVKAWSKADGGTAYTGPLKCIKVRLAESNPNLAGLTSNAAKYEKACAKYAFDGAAILYGHKKKKWFLLTEGSSISQAECKATARLLGADAWADLEGFAAGLGCENID